MASQPAPLGGKTPQGAHTPGLQGLLREGRDSERYIRRLIERAMELLVQPLRDAKAAGVLRPDLELSRQQILFAMFQGVSKAAASRD